MTRPAATLALALLTLACNSTGGPTAPDSWLRIATKHGTVVVDPLADPHAVVAAIERGFERARTRTREPGKLDGLDAEGWTVVVTGRAEYHGPGRVTIEKGGEQALDHEAQHLLADKLGLDGLCVKWQDHYRDGPLGGCDLDGAWSRP